MPWRSVEDRRRRRITYTCDWCGEELTFNLNVDPLPALRGHKCTSFPETQNVPLIADADEWRDAILRSHGVVSTQPAVVYTAAVCSLCSYTSVGAGPDAPGIEHHRCDGLHGLTPKQVSDAAKAMGVDLVILRDSIHRASVIRVSYTADGVIRHIAFSEQRPKRVRTLSPGRAT